MPTVVTQDNREVRDKPKPIMAHLDELRRRLWWVAVVFGATFMAAIIFYDPLIRVLLIPGQKLFSPTMQPIVTSPTEFMGITIKLGIIAGLVVSSPMILYQAIMFVGPAVSKKTERMMLLLLPTTLLLFVAGVIMGYFLVLPTMMRFLLTFGSDIVTPMIRISDYINLIIILLAGLGLAFETPMVMYVLARLRIVSYKGFRRFQKWMIVLAFVIGAIFDPSPNPFDQIVVAGTIITLYEVGILLAWLIRPKQSA